MFLDLLGCHLPNFDLNGSMENQHPILFALGTGCFHKRQGYLLTIPTDLSGGGGLGDIDVFTIFHGYIEVGGFTPG
jgi:hypothetical protein